MIHIPKHDTPSGKAITGRIDAVKRFSHYKKEDAILEREAIVKENPAVQELLRAYKGTYLDNLFSTNQKKIVNDGYLRFLRAIRGIECTANDIALFCLTMKVPANSFENNNRSKTGLFISALIELSDATEFLVDLPRMNPVNYLGYRNRKNVVLVCDAGCNCGDNMRGGEITVHGDAGVNLGYSMQGGHIHVMGKSNGETGFFMKDGRITIEGDCMDDRLGYRMDGGILELNGDFEAIAKSCKGQILHKGVDITRTGRRNNKFD